MSLKKSLYLSVAACSMLVNVYGAAAEPAASEGETETLRRKFEAVNLTASTSVGLTPPTSGASRATLPRGLTASVLSRTHSVGLTAPTSNYQQAPSVPEKPAIEEGETGGRTAAAAAAEAELGRSFFEVATLEQYSAGAAASVFGVSGSELKRASSVPEEPIGDDEATAETVVEREVTGEAAAEAVGEVAAAAEASAGSQVHTGFSESDDEQTPAPTRLRDRIGTIGDEEDTE